MIPRAHTATDPRLVRSLGAIPEETDRAMSTIQTKAYTQWKKEAEKSNDIQIGPTYAHVDLTKKSHPKSSKGAKNSGFENPEDQASISTLEEKTPVVKHQYYAPLQVKAEIHHGTSKKGPAPPPPMAPPAPPAPPIDWDIYIRAVEQHRGPGPHKLNDDEIRRFKVLRNLLMLLH